MKYFKRNDAVFAFESDGSQDYFITSDFVAMSASEVAAHLAPPPPQVPQSITPWQIRKALNQLGLRAVVEAAVAASTDQAVKDGWEFATEFVRTSPFVVSMGAEFGKTDAELDALFILGASL